MAKYKGRTVKLNKPSRGDVKKFKVFVKDRKTGRVKKLILALKKCLSKRTFQQGKDHSWQDLNLFLQRLKVRRTYLQLIGQYNHGKKDLKYD
jgi:hypothetical protein